MHVGIIIGILSSLTPAPGKILIIILEKSKLRALSFLVYSHFISFAKFESNGKSSGARLKFSDILVGPNCPEHC